MRIGLHLCPQKFIPEFYSPNSPPRNKEPFLGRKAINQARFFIVGVKPLQPSIRHRYTAKVTDIFSQCKFPLHKNPWQWFIFIVLLSVGFSFLSKHGKVFFRPPVFEISVSIKLTSLIVKTVGYFVANNRANTTIVDRFICLVIIK